MDARLERELGTLAKHVEALEQLANETDRDASFARRARGAAGAAADARRNLAAQLEIAERAAAEAPEPRRKQLGVAPRRAQRALELQRRQRARVRAGLERRARVDVDERGRGDRRQQHGLADLARVHAGVC